MIVVEGRTGFSMALKVIKSAKRVSTKVLGIL